MTTDEIPDAYRLITQMAAASLRASRDSQADAAPSEELYAACERGDVAGARAALANGANRDYVLPFWNHTVLHRAVFKQHYGVVRLLLEAGAAVDSTTADKSTPLHLAANAGDVRMVELLLEHGAGRDATTIRDELPLALAPTRATRLALELWDVDFEPTRAFFKRLPPGTQFRFRLVLLIHTHLRQLVGRTDSTDDHGNWLRDVVFGDIPHFVVWDILAFVWHAERRMHKFGWQPAGYE